MIQTQTLSRFIHKRERMAAGASGELSDLLSAIALGVKMIANLVATAGLRGHYGASGETNIHGEATQKLDEMSDQILVELLASSGHFGLMVSEERDQVVPTQTSQDRAKYVVAFDPLDGSSNIGSNVAIGTIFSIFRKKQQGAPASIADFLQPGTKLVAAGYSVYGASNTFTYSCGEGVHSFVLDPAIGEFILTDECMRIPEKGSIYSINEGNSGMWAPGLNEFVTLLKGTDPKLKTPYSARYVGSLVADFHRNLKKGGIFLYPADKKNLRGKLRLLYEVMPLAFICEQAGGLATDGQQEILKIVPKDIHERCPFIVGSKQDVELFLQVANKH